MPNFADPIDPGMALAMHHEPAIVAVSFLIALFASFTALDIGGRISSTAGKARAIWLACGAIAMGGGIFSMHFVAMLAMEIGIPMRYEAELTVLSLLVAIAFTGLGFHVVSRHRRNWAALGAAGVLMGLGIAGMHYTGMAAMEIRAEIHYDPVLFSASVAIAVLVASAALWLAFNVTVLWQKAIAAIVMASAICSMHYTGMAAATFIPDDGFVTDITSGISEFTLVVSIAAASTLILTLFLASVIADRRIEAINEREAIRLRDSEERFRRLFDDAAVAMFVMDVNGQINSANRAMSDLLGMSPKELIGAKGPSFVHPDDLDFFAADLAEAKDGSIAVKSVERRFVRTDGQIVWGIASRAVVPDFAKGAMSIFCQIQDVTEQRKSERERTNLEAQLRQTQKLEAIGQLAAGIAHEINTPIQYIGDNLRFVERSFPDISRLITAYRELVKAAKSDRKLRDCIESVEAALSEPELEYLLNEIPSSMNQSIDGVEQVTRIVTAMREFSHPGQHLKALADINRAIKNTVTVSRNEWKESAEMEMSFDPDLGLVNCVVGELNQAFLNLVVNAAQAVAAAGRGPDGRIRVSTRQEGPWAIIRIADNGAGIPAEFHDRVFEPFFTTKEIGKGTGQGLSIAYEIIVNRHGGEIEFSSEPGAGTEFVIRLPAEDSEIASEAA